MFKKKLKFLTYNVQDFFLFLDHYNGEDLNTIDEEKWSSFSTSLRKNKPLEKITGVQKVIQDVDPDVILLIEIGGRESLENFNKYFLQNSYQIFILPTNSNRGIEIGYLVKNKYSAKIKSYKNYKLPNNERFKRDVAELRLFYKNKLKLIFLGVHFKSKLDLDKTDFEGRSQRSNEIKGLKNIFLALRKSIHKIPIVIAGDFNGIIQIEGREPEFHQLVDDTELTDILDLVKIPIQDRFTHLYFGVGPEPIANQIDYILIENKFQKNLINNLCYVYRYRNNYGDLISIDNYNEKKDLPSDHFPVLMGINF